ncbi:glyoxalase [Nocardioides humilatus]|uniref:Glyoxalase n=1 Tax=Nocardioides humilatus TaxID=2607660 RepID=A0A5B1L6N8_9ACTN|nr:glyoxalase [Nocardioides humilatus]KAA1415440.1 glyoxalase [Nocardioides humilatus]
MNSIDTITLDVTDVAAARTFYEQAFGPSFDTGAVLELHAVDAAPTGFQGFTVSLVMAQPSDVNAVFEAALAAGATAIKPVTKSFWGYGGTLLAPDGAIWKIACSAKKDSAPVARTAQDVVLLLGCEDVAATKRDYLEKGLTVARSFGKKYVEFEAGGSPVKVALYGRKALAKDAGVPA